MNNKINNKILTISVLATVITLIIFLSGCLEKEHLEPAVNNTGSTPEGVNAVVNANNQFAFDIYSQFRGESKDDNIFFSPYSISTALAMTYEGAKGKTSEEMRAVLHLPDDKEKIHSDFVNIYNELNKADKPYKLTTANALWAQKDYKFLDKYTGNVENYYGGKVTNLDFITETEKSRKIINDWVKAQTNNKIKDLIPQGVLGEMTRLVLTNAIYFKGTWVKQFDKKDTQDQNFKTGSGNTVKVPMMGLTSEDVKFNYTENDKLQLLEIPYDGEELSMLILLPKESYQASLEESLKPEKISEWKNMLQEQRVDIYIPKFKFETKYFMAETLKKMGMPSAFSPSVADFSGIDGTKNLYIANVIHQAFVEVNEEGIEAAAATAVVVELTSSVGPRIPVFYADHPFIFIIQERKTGNILFLGRVSDPTG